VNHGQAREMVRVAVQAEDAKFRMLETTAGRGSSLRETSGISA
jgi:hypothetical protein